MQTRVIGTNSEGKTSTITCPLDKVQAAIAGLIALGYSMIEVVNK